MNSSSISGFSGSGDEGSVEFTANDTNFGLLGELNLDLKLLLLKHNSGGCVDTWLAEKLREVAIFCFLI